MILRRPTILLGILLATLSTYAQQTSTTATKDPQAVAVLTQSLNAVGGLAAVTAIQDYTGTGNITYNWAGEQVQAPVTVRGMGISNFRVDSTLPNGTRTFAAGGYSGVLIAPDGSRQPTSAYNLFTAGSLTFPYVRIAATLADSTTSISFVGTVSVNGQSVYQIHFVPALDPAIATNSTLQGLGAFDLYVDPPSLLVTELVETIYSGSNFRTKLSHEIDFANYQTAGTVRVPFIITETVNGQQTWSITLSSMTFDSGLTTAEFNP